VGLLAPGWAGGASLGEEGPVGVVAVAKGRGSVALAASPARMAGRELAVVARSARADSGLSGSGHWHAAAERASVDLPSAGMGLAERESRFLDGGPGPGLVPYSRYRTEVHLLAVQMYAWGYSTYQRTGQALGVVSMTAYRWVSAWGYALLPVAALFGMKSSGKVLKVWSRYL
jgi:hypothetical protein